MPISKSPKPTRLLRYLRKPTDSLFEWKYPLDEHVYISFDAHKDNFGDILTPIVVDYLSDKNVVRISSVKTLNSPHYLVIGSVLQKATCNSSIWGSGFISEDSQLREIPEEIYAVRGPLTRKKLLEMDIDCPEVYGDPALLMPEIYEPASSKKKYELGIIPHYVDKDHSILNLIDDYPEICLIDVQNPNPLEVIDAMNACKKIVSSSLHGIIVADAYGIPAKWIQFSEDVIGNGFKFKDYFMSVNRSDWEPYYVYESTRLTDFFKLDYDYEFSFNRNKLIKSCPF